MRDPKADVLPVCAELGVTFVPFCPLGCAFLSGVLYLASLGRGDFRASLPRDQAEAARQNLRLERQVDAFATRAEAAQVALAWLLAKSRVGAPIVPIPGTRRPERGFDTAYAYYLVAGCRRPS